MPFALRKVQPEYVSRARLHDQDGRPLVQDDELEAVFNHTLCQAIRQLSSLLEAADDMFAGLTKEMAGVTTRAGALQERIKKVQDLVDAEDPRIVPVHYVNLSVVAPAVVLASAVLIFVMEAHDDDDDDDDVALAVAVSKQKAVLYVHPK
ncbi:hypothetical protein FOCC_FOCC005090 [Frankliniella occidentalis]|nr:hypothetical protein FOCC_FOCC005090 [Frankliniella occidentalis]